MKEYLDFIIIYFQNNSAVFLLLITFLILGIIGVTLYLTREILKKYQFSFLGFFFILIFLLAIFGGYFAYFKYNNAFPDFWPNSETESTRGGWGALGDYVGGILNPLFSFLSLLLFLITIIIHLYELRDTKREIKKSTKHQKKIAKKQEKVTNKQIINSQIESRKNNLNATRNSVIVRIPITTDGIITDRLIYYPHSFKFIFDIFRNNDSYQDYYSMPEKEILEQVFRNFNNELLEKYGITVENYISAFFSLLNYINYLHINTNNIKDLLAIHIESLRDSLTPYEAAIIFYASVNNNSWKELLEKYEMFKILVNKENLIPKEHWLYYKSVF
ncbi:MAG TPA: hypothetical protein ENK59_04980 [Thioploca sp.]|nr:hypothetical protein [Thioploca sp.]